LKLQRRGGDLSVPLMAMILESEASPGSESATLEQRRDLMMKRRIRSVAGVMLVVLVLSAVLTGCSPPVDLSNVPTLPASGSPEPIDVVPDSLLGEDLSDLWDSSGVGDTSLTGMYGEVVIVICRATNAANAARILKDELQAFRDAAQSSSVTETGDWFKFSGNIDSAFYWKKGTWVYGVVAPDDETMIQAAEALIAHLADLEY